MSRKETAIAFLRLAASGKAREAFRTHVGAGFRHHNPWFRGDAESLIVAMDENAAQAMSLNPNVLFVEQDSLFTINVTQSPATWGIDRIDQRNLPLSNSYTYDFTGAGVRAFILDTDIRTTHTNFGGRASWGRRIPRFPWWPT